MRSGSRRSKKLSRNCAEELAKRREPRSRLRHRRVRFPQCKRRLPYRRFLRRGAHRPRRLLPRADSSRRRRGCRAWRPSRKHPRVTVNGRSEASKLCAAADGNCRRQPQSVCAAAAPAEHVRAVPRRSTRRQRPCRRFPLAPRIVARVAEESADGLLAVQVDAIKAALQGQNSCGRWSST